ncbi:MAG: hypothetical protein J6K28_06415 [Alistipes sp.]|nr:hypothetical protein [Alistipes sp.]
MKKILVSASCAVLACAAAGCVKDAAIDNGSSAVPVSGRITATVESPEVDSDTRTAFNGSDMYIRWEEGDKIGLFGSESGKNVQATLDPSFAGEYIGEFTYSGGDVAGDIVGYYPYHKDSGMDSVMKLFLPDEQYFPTLADAVRACILCAKADADGNFEFFNTCSILEVKLKGSDKLMSVDVMHRRESLSGWGEVDMTTSDRPVFVPTKNLSDTRGLSYGGVHANVNGKITLSAEPVSLFFVVPAGEYAAGDIYIQAVTDGYATTTVSSAVHTLERNHIKPFKAISVAPMQYGAVEDLSADGKANCYVVRPSSETKHYSFSIKDVDGNDLISHPAYSAQVAWQTSDNLVTNVSTDIASKTVTFTVPGDNVQGSALITLNTSTNRGIFWAWHIWISDVDDQTWGTAPVTMMDRNLGAMWKPANEDEVKAMTPETAALTGGFFYQWGRPVPFPMMKKWNDTNSWGYEGSAWKSNTQEVVINHFYRWTQAFAGKSMTGNVADARWWPMAFLKDIEEGSATQDAWARDIVTRGENATWSTAKKTKYDPCPAGYRVPSIDEGVYLRWADGQAASKVMTMKHNPSVAGGDAKSSFGGYAVNGDNFVWVPKSGRRDCGNNTVAAKKRLDAVGRGWLNGFYYNTGNGNAITTGEAVMWVCADDDMSSWTHYKTTTSNPYPLSSGDIYQRYLLMEAGNVWAEKDTRKKMSVGMALPVRCVKIVE